MSSRKTATLTLKVPSAMKSLIEEHAAAANAASLGEFVVSIFQERLEEQERARLEQLLLEGLNSGPAIPVDDAFWKDMEKRLAERSKAKPRKKRQLKQWNSDLSLSQQPTATCLIMLRKSGPLM